MYKYGDFNIVLDRSHLRMNFPGFTVKPLGSSPPRGEFPMCYPNTYEHTYSIGFSMIPTIDFFTYYTLHFCQPNLRFQCFCSQILLVNATQTRFKRLQIIFLCHFLNISLHFLFVLIHVMYL